MEGLLWDDEKEGKDSDSTVGISLGESGSPSVSSPLYPPATLLLLRLYPSLMGDPLFPFPEGPLLLLQPIEIVLLKLIHQVQAILLIIRVFFQVLRMV